MSEAKQIDPIKACRLIVAFRPSVLDEATERLIRELFDGVVINSIPDLALAFDVKAATIRHTWRQDRTMPGSSGRGKSSFPLAEVLIWWIKKNASAAVGRGATEDSKRKAAAEAEKAEIDARRARRALDREEGQVASVDLIRSEWDSGLAVLSNDVMSIPRDVKPVLCKKCAETGGAEIERLLRLSLLRFSEKTVDQVLEKQTNGHHG